MATEAGEAPVPPSQNSHYSDLAESERAHILENFEQITTRWSQINRVGTENEDEDGKDEQRSHMIVVTDACLPLLASGESPISGHLLINYELPAKKEAYMRRIATCLAAGPLKYRVLQFLLSGSLDLCRLLKLLKNVQMDLSSIWSLVVKW